MRLIARSALLLLTAITSLTIYTTAAFGNDGHDLKSGTDSASVRAWKSHETGAARPGKHQARASRTQKPKQAPSDSGFERAFADQQTKTAAYKNYLNAVRTWDQCVGSGAISCARPAAVAPPGELAAPGPLIARGGLDPLPSISPEEAAYIAVARLHLTPPKPMIGPPPEINEWKMAAVGYPMWLWAEGNLNPAPVSDTVYDLTVSLDARLVKVTFDMGDGHRQTCADVSHRWVRGTTPGAPSPGCGHTYTRPSLPKGKYTITAYSTWSVAWSVNGVGGTIPLYQQASTTVPVGELQVLTR